MPHTHNVLTTHAEAELCHKCLTVTEALEDENAEHTDGVTHITTNRMAEVTDTVPENLVMRHSRRGQQLPCLHWPN